MKNSFSDPTFYMCGKTGCMSGVTPLSGYIGASGWYVNMQLPASRITEQYANR